MEVEVKNPSECQIQLPSQTDLAGMKYMPAGLNEDQSLRQETMAQTIQSFHTQLPIINPDENHCTTDWLSLFEAIKQINLQKAFQKFEEIPDNDWILKPLVAIHSKDYLKQIISHCIKAFPYGKSIIKGGDVVFTPNTFEILIKDLACTLNSTAQTIFSFGLPTHHAYREDASGFCILNKTAVLIKHLELTHPKPLHYLIIGTDVNRDNGLCNVLLHQASNLNIHHIDIFDSRVYPGQNEEYIGKEFYQQAAKPLENKIKYWQKELFRYYMVDLSLTVRTPNAIHPALVFAINSCRELLDTVKASKEQLVIILPTGWDSHVDEMAACGKFVGDHFLTKAESNKTRFKDSDLIYFYEKLFELFVNNKDHILKLYWGLEGGYEPSMYVRQVELLMGKIEELLLKPTAEIGFFNT